MPDEPEISRTSRPRSSWPCGDELAKRLKADGKATEAAEVKKRRKPTVTRWVAEQFADTMPRTSRRCGPLPSHVATAQETAITEATVARRLKRPCNVGTR